MRYFEAYGFYFQSRKWALNLLFGSICGLVPVAGPMMLTGWAFSVLMRAPERRWGRDSDFDANQLGAYIMRGLWPVLLQLIIGIPVNLVAAILWFVLLFGGGIVAAAGNSGWIFAILFPGYFLCMVLVSVVIHLISMPLCLRAGLSEDFASAFDLSWALDFMKRTWVEIILSGLFLAVTEPFLILSGMLACFVGIYPVQALIFMATYHLWFQIYELYLERGGEPVPLKVNEWHLRYVPDEN